MQLLGTQWICTTAYRPKANGLLERFHCHLKGALKCLPDRYHWTKALPLILLGIQTTLKQDLKCITAEMVYGTTLRLPGEFFSPSSTHSNVDPASYASQLKVFMQNIRSPSVYQQKQRRCHMSPDLNTCTFVFVHHDAVRKSLQPPYDGPVRVLKRHNKHYTLDILGKEKVISLDRLKPAYLDDNASDVSPQPDISPQQDAATTTEPHSPDSPLEPSPSTTPYKTRSGCSVHWPKRFAQYRMFTYQFNGGGVM